MTNLTHRLKPYVVLLVLPAVIVIAAPSHLRAYYINCVATDVEVVSVTANTVPNPAGMGWVMKATVDISVECSQGDLSNCFGCIRANVEQLINGNWVEFPTPYFDQTPISTCNATTLWTRGLARAPFFATVPPTQYRLKVEVGQSNGIGCSGPYTGARYATFAR
jgi:hypothetical protein